MGLVYAAHDPELDREVAIKLLRARPGDSGSSATDPQGDGRTRLLREAQALAKLAHPNVIAVYDVGSYDLTDADLSRILPDRADIPLQGVFVVMELVDGPTLTQWLQTKREWREILRTFIAAGWGLAAAHDQGFVHRDFKPGNVLVGTDRRVRVLDFGLTRALDAAESMVMPVLSADDLDFGERLTSTGFVVGTPLYMAPEQHRGQTIDARTDQYSFCLSLYEALYGGLDILDRDPEVLLKWKLRPPQIPEDSDVPEGIAEALCKGLQVDPDRRHASMGVLLRALEREIRRPRRRWAALGMGVAASVVGVVLGLRLAGPSCSEVDDALAQMWSSERRAAVQGALVSTGAPFAERTAEAVTTRLDGYARRWAADRRAICEAATARSDATTVDDARLQCSDRARQAFGATLEVLTAADVEVLIAAVASVDALPRLDCKSLTEVPPMPAPPDDEELASRVEGVRATLLKARSLDEAGRYGEALALARQARESTQAIPYAPVQAEALLEVGVGLVRTAAFERAASTLEEAAHLADSVGHDEVVGRAAVNLVFALGGLGRVDDALTWYRHGQTALRRLPRSERLQRALEVNIGHLYRDTDRLDEARRAYTLAMQLEEGEDEGGLVALVCLEGLGIVDLLEGRLPSARERLEEALGRGEGVLGPSHPTVAMIRLNLGAVLVSEGLLDEALGLYEQSLQDFRSAHGPDHASVALAHHHLASLLDTMGRAADALPHVEKALAIRRLILGSDHQDTLASMVERASIRVHLGNPEAAIAELEQAAATYETRGDEAQLGRTLSLLGTALAESGRCDDARERLVRATSVLERAHRSDHAEMAEPLLGLASCKTEVASELEGALHDVERAEAILEQALGGEHVRVARARALRGRILVRLGRRDDGIALLEGSLALIDRDAGPIDRARVRHFLADALLATDRERARAVALETRALLETAGPSGARPLATIQAWLDHHGF